MPVDMIAGASPLILAFPYSSTKINRPVFQRLNETGQKLADTDWHIDQLYLDIVDDATYVRADFHRYVCDANRDPTGRSLYPGHITTGLVPLTNFKGEELWDQPPSKAEMATWRAAFHAPYHAALTAQIARVRARYGFAILFDCLSSKSTTPEQFENALPDLSIGTFMGASCDHKLTAQVAGICLNDPAYTSEVNGRSKGGWTTRHHGRPKSGVHALQMELAQSTYLVNEPDVWRYDDTKAEGVRQVLAKILLHLQSWSPK
ncbi:N-formylglutamate amidohydrolase [Roseobacter sp.]|uniref:N-formylglutamate amidohydrolase n=1 Tax=Roseobacter sp. TaxID=1907202 RepID=UPI00385D846F